MKIKMNLDIIQSVAVDGENTVVGYVCDTRSDSNVTRAPLELTRYFDGWTPCIRIKLNDAIIFDGKADDEQRADFDVLRAMGRGQECERQSKRKMDARDMAKAVKLFTNV